LNIIRFFLFIFLISASITSYSQVPDSTLKNFPQLPDKYYSKVDKKISSVNDQLTKKSLKYLAKFQSQELKLQQRLQKLHPELAVNNSTDKYTELFQKIKSKTSGITGVVSGEYNPYMDSLGTSLSFLKQFNGISDKVNNPLKSFELLQGNLQESEKVKAFIAERKNQIKELLSKYTHLPAGLKNEYSKLNKTAYYYSSEVKEIRGTMKDPDKLEKKALSILNQLPAFQKFMKENGQLASLFRLPDSSLSGGKIIPKGEESIGFLVRGVCKGYSFVYPISPAVEISSNEKNTQVSTLPIKKRSQLLQVKGNISYDVNYRSRIDTPYAEKNIYQHTLQTRLDFVYKEQYPFKIYLTTRFSNSSLFRKYTDLNFQYRKADFVRLLKQRIIEVAESYILSRKNGLDSLSRLIDLEKAKIASLSHSLQKPDIRQRLVEERERQLFENGTEKSTGEVSGDNPDMQKRIIPRGESKFPSIFQNNSKVTTAANNTGSDIQKFYSYKDSLDDKKKMLESLITELDKTEKLYNNLKSVQQLNQNKWKNDINNANDANSLTQNLRELHIPDTVLPKGYKTLYSIQSFNIGRSMVNYSELSVKDISITGIQAEYNPHYYYAFAAGKVDYRFRDYIIPGNSLSNQYLALVRFGKGTKNGNHIIFTYYTGKRQFFNSSIALRSNDLIPVYNLAGITIEGFYKLSRNVSLITEVAKSTMPYYSLDSLQKKNWINSVTRFKDRSNEAYSVRLNSYFPKTQTRFSGDIRYTGANFQSFSTFTTGASQTRWSARLEQPFFKKKLTVFSSLQQNDYSNPFVTTTYKSSSVLASLQATLRIKKWPFLSLGYYPSYQLTKINNNNYSENRYYTLVANSGYYYHIHSAQLSSYIVFSKFYNGASDSGFVYFNSKNLLISQTAVIKRVSFELNGSLSVNTGYTIYTIENNDQFTISRLLSVGGGLKMIKQTLLNDLLWGYSGNIRLNISKLGDIQLMSDKGFIPGVDRKLVTNNMGRLTYFKTF
jgi:hypothetical protein